MNLTDGRGVKFTKMVVACSLLVEVLIRSGMLTIAGSLWGEGNYP
jgi:hypothetical protein